MGVHQATYLHHRKSINPCGVRSFIPAPKRPPCHRILRVNHYRFKSREEWVLKAMRGGGTTREPYNLSLIEDPDYNDVITNDTVMDWYIPQVKANLQKKFSCLPCHVRADPNYYDNSDFHWMTQNFSLTAGEPYSWMRAMGGVQVARGVSQFPPPTPALRDRRRLPFRDRSRRKRPAK
jgi:hypothetical protein